MVQLTHVFWEGNQRGYDHNCLEELKGLLNVALRTWEIGYCVEDGGEM